MMSLIKALRGLFGVGACPAGDASLGPSLTPLLGGLAHPSEDGIRWVMSRRLLGIRQDLTTDDEGVAAILAHEMEPRSGWARILAARCREAGLLPDANALVQLVSRLDGAATWVEAAMAEGSLAPTASGHLERELLGATAEQARTTPTLVRVMAAASVLERWRPEPLPILAPVDLTGEHVDTNWCAGRLLALPGTPDCDSRYLLTGTWGGDVDGKALETLQNWVLPNPWPLLLAAIGYVQDAWAAEARGGLLLELPPGQNPHHPSEVQVLVAGADGAELLCGSLGGLVLGLLRRLQMRLFPQDRAEAELNLLLSPLIGELLRRQVWRYQEGLSGQQGHYQLHPRFSDACYQITGARSLGRHGRALRRAIRDQADQWRLDWQGRGGERLVGPLRGIGAG